MPDTTWNDVDRYLCDHLLDTDPGWTRRWSRAGRRGFRRSQWRRTRASCSRSWCGRSGRLGPRDRDARRLQHHLDGQARCPADGRIVTLEAPRSTRTWPRPTSSAPGSPTGSRSAGAPRSTRWPRCRGGRGPFDFVFIDADKENTRAYFDCRHECRGPARSSSSTTWCATGASIVADTTDAQVLGMREFFDYVRREDRVEITGDPDGRLQGLRRLCARRREGALRRATSAR